MAERNFENRTLFKGDNLDFLRGMNSETVDLIATDPPFNKDKDFHATPESLAAGARFQDRWRWNEDVQPEWVDAIKDDKPRVYSLIDYTIGGLSNNTINRKKRGGAGGHRRVSVLYGCATHRDATPTQRHGQPIPALRPYRQPLPQSPNGRDIRG